MDYSKPTSAPLVLGILSTIFSVLVFTTPVAFVLGIIGTVMGYKAKEVSGSSGFVLSIIGLSISSLILLKFVALFSFIILPF